MKCWFCLAEKRPSDEHIFPLAIGGPIRTDRVCRECNSQLGGAVDSGLTNHLLAVLPRSTLGLAGNSGQTPDGLATLMRNGRLADDPNQRVRMAIGSDGRPELKLLYRREEHIEGDELSVRIHLDVKDAHQLPTIIERERARAGLQPLDPAELATVISSLTSNPQRIEQPRVQGQALIATRGFERGLLKIAYELGCLWLGDEYLDDLCAARLRAVVMGALPTDALDGWAAAAIGVPPPLKRYLRGRNEHVAFALTVGETLFLNLSVFGVFNCSVKLTLNGSAYVATDWPGRLLRIDAATRQWSECTLRAEEARLRDLEFRLQLLRGSSLSGLTN